MTGQDPPTRGPTFGADCRCWCQVRPIVCTLSGCACILHNHDEETHMTDHEHAHPGQPPDNLDRAARAAYDAGVLAERARIRQLALAEAAADPVAASLEDFADLLTGPEGGQADGT